MTVRSMAALAAGIVGLFAVAAMASSPKPFIDDLSQVDVSSSKESKAADTLVVLVHDGEPTATIILPHAPPKHTQRAADLLVDHVQKMSGAELPVVDDPADVATKHRIWVGMRPELKTQFAELDFTFATPEEFLIHAQANDLLIVGRDVVRDGEPIEAATYLAMSTFLQERLGVRWFWPGELGTDVFAVDNIAFEPFEHRYHPQIRWRAPRVVNAASRWRQSRRRDGQTYDLDEVRAPNKIELRNRYVGGSDEAMAALARQRDEENQHWLNLQRGNHGGGDNAVLAGSLDFRGGHAFGDWFDRFAEDHPEWFAMDPDGVRVSEMSPEDRFPPSGRHAKLCVSNPEVAEQFLNDAEQYFNENPHATVISASPNDMGYHGYCMCENCKAWDEPDAPLAPRTMVWRNHEMQYVQLSDRYAKFWNRLARGLKERFPGRDVNIGVWAYVVYRPAPVATKLEDNIYIGYVGLRHRHVTNNKVSMQQ